MNLKLLLLTLALPVNLNVASRILVHALEFIALSIMHESEVNSIYFTPGSGLYFALLFVAIWIKYCGI